MGKLKGKGVLVTGASGFIGSHLVKGLLKEGANVSAIGRKSPKNAGISYFSADICDANSLCRAIINIKPQIIVHLVACMDRTAPNEEVIRINYQGTVNLFDALDQIEYQRFIYISTSELYFGNEIPFLENMDLNPQTAYARSKLMAEEYCITQSKEKRKPITILRPAIVYGPGQSESMFIPQCVASTLRGENMKMTAGEQTRDFVYIDDVVEAIVRASYMPLAVGEIINIGSGIETTLKEAALKINELAGNAMQINFGALPYRENEIRRYLLDITKAKQVLGWEPKVSLEEGLKKAIEAYKQNM